MASIDLALSLAARGWAVFPVGKNKRPIIGEWTTRATTDEARLRDLFAGYPSCAVGIACGRASGLFVVDVDGNGEHPIHDRLDPTLVVGTPSGGFHYYYAMPDDVVDDDVLRNTQKAEACLGYPDVDTRGIGGYVVAPGSVTAGGTYEILSDVPPAPIPTWVVEAMRAYKRAKAAPQAQQRASLPMMWRDASVAQERARRYAERMPGSVSGQGGHVAAMKVARAIVTGFGLDEGAALDVMRHWNAKCSPPWSEKELAHKVREAATKPDPQGHAPGHMLDRLPADPFGGAAITGTEVFDVVDGEAITSAPSASVAKPRQFVRLPEPDDRAQWDLLEEIRALGGLCDTFPTWALAGADYPQPGLTVGALVALGSALGQRRWTFERTTTSAIVVSVAPTASGKGRPQQALQQVLRECWPAAIGANDWSSTQSTINRIEAATAQGVGLLLVLDEYGPRLKSLFDSRNGHQKEMRALILTLSTIGTGSYVAATSATKGGQDRIIRAPGLTILGSSTPAALHDAIGKLAVEDGFMGRHLWCEGLSVLPKRQRAAAGSAAIPRAVAEAVRACRESHEAWHRGHPELGDAAKGDPLALYVPEEAEDAGAADLLFQYGEHCDDRRRHPVPGDVPPALLGRCAEQATRTALALAILCCEWPAWPRVTRPMAEAAIRLTEASGWTISRSLRDHSAPAWDDAAGRVAYVEAAIQRLADAEGWCDRSDLLRACRSLDAMALDATLARLADEGGLEAHKVATGGRGRPATRLRLIG
jgi:hypothetical protein